ncbi:hypothetical protein DPMN_012502 [Dreissena polymorpha]|uniref:BED-type domain-containing protein n=1 Tax=Dreissena polymorpha TaxID=45954 RepID=A0A9D4S3F1_DREPO|nr:hypothetical protein DPMN_012502 [Dreissena polymorpha]
MPPTPSAAWKYFTRSSNKKSATCNLCGVNLLTGGNVARANFGKSHMLLGMFYLYLQLLCHLSAYSQPLDCSSIN